MTDPWQERLSEYLDGELAPVEREALEQHLFACADCTLKLSQLRQVVERARSLEDVPPERDLWPGILKRIAAAGAPEPGEQSVADVAAGISFAGAGASAAGPRSASRDSMAGEILPGGERRAGTRGETRSGGGWGGGAGWRRTFSLSVTQLAAAAMLVLLIGGGAVWLARLGSPGTTVGPLAEDVPGDTTRTRGSGSLEATLVSGGSLGGPRYDAAVAELEQALAEGRGRLAPSTLEVVRQNLKIIDGAIADAQRALASDPGNVYLNGHLAATMRRKLELLRRASEIARAQT